ncbi:MAG: YbjQ family protein [Sarcina sp.]
MKDFLVTTTNTIEGYHIEKYHGYISSNLVIGADFFSDMFASFTDFFGGVSGRYTDEIDQLKEFARVSIQSKAKSLGMNAIVGFKVDLDPIFGSGYSMFMISATGTAVRIRKIGEENAMQKIEDEIRETLGEVHAYSKVIDRNTFNILTSSPQEIEGYIGSGNNVGLEIVKNIEVGILTNKNTVGIDKNFLRFNIINEYLSRCDDYEMVQKYVSTDITDVKAYIIKKFDLISYSKILDEFKKGDINKEMMLLYCLEANPRFVSKDDYKGLCELLNYLNSRYDNNVEIKKSGLVKSKVTWVCKKCNAKVDQEREVCHICDTNRYGIAVRFKNYSGKEIYVNFSNILAKLEKTKELLRKYYL